MVMMNRFLFVMGWRSSWVDRGVYMGNLIKSHLDRSMTVTSKQYNVFPTKGHLSPE
jgi:hypothetical protein